MKISWDRDFMEHFTLAPRSFCDLFGLTGFAPEIQDPTVGFLFANGAPVTSSGGPERRENSSDAYPVISRFTLKIVNFQPKGG